MNRYWGHGSRMSADLKNVIKRVRKNRPDLFVAQRVRESKMDGEGKVAVTVRDEIRAVPMSPADRHRLSWSKEYH